jgi:hypothetical protein
MEIELPNEGVGSRKNRRLTNFTGMAYVMCARRALKLFSSSFRI